MEKGKLMKHYGAMKLILGLVIVSWGLWYPQVDWRIFFGALIAVLGLVKLTHK
ncbi:hypothetical protein ACFLZ7_02365 [Nanoarchaeota archaeon]